MRVRHFNWQIYIEVPLYISLSTQRWFFWQCTDLFPNRDYPGLCRTPPRVSGCGFALRNGCPDGGPDGIFLPIFWFAFGGVAAMRPGCKDVEFIWWDVNLIQAPLAPRSNHNWARGKITRSRSHLLEKRHTRGVNHKGTSECVWRCSSLHLVYHLFHKMQVPDKRIN